MVVANAQFVRIASLRARRNREKLGFGPVKIVPGCSKIRPGASQNNPKTIRMTNKSPTKSQEAGTSEKKAPKDGKCANIVPTWQDLEYHFEVFWPPLVRRAACSARRVKSYCILCLHYHTAFPNLMLNPTAFYACITILHFLIPCAAHVPPRCRGETKSQSK